MAEVIREGGKSPLEVKSWQDAVKVLMLNRMCDGGQFGANKGEMLNYIFHKLNFDAVQNRFNHRVFANEVDTLNPLLMEMIRDGWIGVVQFITDCYEHSEHHPEKAVRHGVQFGLTTAGYDKVSGHIFP